MSCSKCNKQPNLPPAALEIINQCDPVLFHKVIFPAALGDDTTVPPDTLNYKNVLLVYEANEHAYLYSSDGAATFISMAAIDLTAIKEELAQHGIDIDNLKTEVATLQGDVETLQNGLAEETQNRQDADENLQDQITTNAQSISSLNTTVATQGEQITNLETNLQDTTTELQTDIANEALAREDADDTLQSNIDAINTNLNQEIEKETDFTTDTSTVTVQHTKVNLSNNDTNITTDPLPVASETQAGVMNTATYQAVQNNAENVDAILNGAVALEDISATPTQEELTQAWETATGKTTLINRASIYDITNDKVWYYYENINEWKALTATGEGEVSISTFTNTTPGIIKGSENDGQLFAEADGTGSVVGWDGVKHDVENIVELLETNPIPKLYDTYSTATDGANTAAFINNKLNDVGIAIGTNAGTTGNFNPQAILLGLNTHLDAASQYAASPVIIGSNARMSGTTSVNLRGNYNGVAVGNNSHVTGNSVALGYQAKSNEADSVALGSTATVTRQKEVSIGNSNATGAQIATRFLANVTAGELDTDAVNVKQMKDYVGTNAQSPTIIHEIGWGISPESQNVAGAINGLTLPLKAGTQIIAYCSDTDPNPIELPVALSLNGQSTTILNSSTNALTYKSGTYIRYTFMRDFTGESRAQLIAEYINLGEIMTPEEFNAAWEAA